MVADSPGPPHDTHSRAVTGDIGDTVAVSELAYTDGRSHHWYFKFNQ